MANASLKDKLHHTGDDKKEKFSSLTMQKSRLNKAKISCEKNNDCSEFNRLGGSNELKKINNIVTTAQDTNYVEKKIAMDGGAKNQFIKTHIKNRDNANPTAIGGVPNVTKGNIKDKIMSNTEVYNEAIAKEISNIRYLIEYMNKNKQIL
jgi:hypothetical protein